MRKISVTLKGVTPLLMNSPKSMVDDALTEKGVKSATEKYNYEELAEKLAYRTKEGKLYVPAEAIKGSLIGAASYKKIDKFTAKPIIAGGVFIPEQELILNKNTYELDYRTVVIQGKSRVVKARPMVKDWKLEFEIIYNESLIKSPMTIKDLLIEAGQRVGILDFRPQKSGSFGLFIVEKFELVDESKPLAKVKKATTKKAK